MQFPCRKQKRVLSESENQPHSFYGLPFRFCKREEFEAYQRTDVKELWMHSETTL